MGNAEKNIVMNVQLNGVREAVSKVAELEEKIREAKTAATELASLLEKLEVKV